MWTVSFESLIERWILLLECFSLHRYQSIWVSTCRGTVFQIFCLNREVTFAVPLRQLYRKNWPLNCFLGIDRSPIAQGYPAIALMTLMNGGGNPWWLLLSGLVHKCQVISPGWDSGEAIAQLTWNPPPNPCRISIKLNNNSRIGLVHWASEFSSIAPSRTLSCTYAHNSPSNPQTLRLFPFPIYPSPYPPALPALDKC